MHMLPAGTCALWLRVPRQFAWFCWLEPAGVSGESLAVLRTMSEVLSKLFKASGIVSSFVQP